MWSLLPATPPPSFWFYFLDRDSHRLELPKGLFILCPSLLLRLARGNTAFVQGCFAIVWGQCSAHSNCSANIYWTKESEMNTPVKRKVDSITSSFFFFKNTGLPLRSLSPSITWKCSRPRAMEFSRVLPVQAKRIFSGFFNFFRRRLSEQLPSAWPSFRFKSICW